MCECLKKIRWDKVLLAALVYLAIGFVLRQIEVMLTIRYYMMPEYLSVWSRLMMPHAGPPPLEFTLISILFAYLTGVVLAALFAFTGGLFEKTYWSRVSGYTLMVSLLMLVIGHFPLLLLINLPFLLILSWFITSILTVFLSTLVFAKLLK